MTIDDDNGPLSDGPKTTIFIPQGPAGTQGPAGPQGGEPWLDAEAGTRQILLQQGPIITDFEQLCRLMDSCGRPRPSLPSGISDGG